MKACLLTKTRKLIYLCFLLFCFICFLNRTYAALLLDPTMPPSYKGARLKRDLGSRGVTISSIWYGPNKKIAVVNGKLLHEGDEVHGVKVIEIKQHSVIFKEGAHEFTVPLYSYTIEEVGSKKGEQP